MVCCEMSVYARIVFRMAGVDRGIRVLLRKEWIVRCTFSGGGWIVGHVG